MGNPLCLARRNNGRASSVYGGLIRGAQVAAQSPELIWLGTELGGANEPLTAQNTERGSSDPVTPAPIPHCNLGRTGMHSAVFRRLLVPQMWKCSMSAESHNGRACLHANYRQLLGNTWCEAQCMVTPTCRRLQVSCPREYSHHQLLIMAPKQPGNSCQSNELF